MTGVGADAKL